jgi:hypothetical protein
MKNELSWLYRRVIAEEHSVRVKPQHATWGRTLPMTVEVAPSDGLDDGRIDVRIRAAAGAPPMPPAVAASRFPAAISALPA